MSGDKLLPCPFCGTDEFLMLAHSVLGAHSFWQVECGCHASGAPEYIRMDAVREWNTRHGTTELVEALRRIVDAPMIDHANPENSAQAIARKALILHDRALEK